MYPVPYPDMSMRQYAALLSQQIDTSEPFVLIGTSLGGMLATEMSTFLTPEKVIIISSAKSRKELPHRYRFQRFIPIYDWIPAALSKRGALLLQPLVEPDRNQRKDVFVNMLKDKDPIFLKRTIQMIIEWDRKDAPENIIHIHGNLDHTLPHKHVNYNHLIETGSHMMALTRSDEISLLLLRILNEE